LLRGRCDEVAPGVLGSAAMRMHREYMGALR